MFSSNNMLPSIHVISLEESFDRREILKENWFKKYNISNFKFHIFKRVSEYKDYVFEGPFVHEIDDFSKGVSSSHLSALKSWYEETTEPYTLIFEDDVSFETVQYWNFSWKEFIDALPANWNCVQLVVKKTEFKDKNLQFHSRQDFEWSTAAYLIKREYAKFLLDSYHPKENLFTFDIKGTNIIPVAEQLLFINSPHDRGVYSFPLFVEEVHWVKTTNPNEDKNTQFSFDSYDIVLSWWKQKGKTLTLDQIFNRDKFDWGIENQEFISFVSHEIFIDKVYEKFYDIKENDIVIDIGASSGPFAYSILNKNPKQIYCLEPSKKFFEILQKNMKNFPVTCINKAISSKKNNEDLIIFWTDSEENVETISFQSFLKENNIESVDMLKMDCEGGEYDILCEENLNFVLNNVRNIAAELHFVFGDDKFHAKFKNFKENILPKIPHYKIYSISSSKEVMPEDVTHKINIPNYVENRYHQLMLYVQKTPFTSSFSHRGKIIDCFSFSGERHLLDLRYSLLNTKVDKFVVLDVSQKNKKTGEDCVKELNLPKEKFIFVSASEKQNSNLDSFMNILHLFAENDVFFFSDCSDIIKPECIDYFADMAFKNSSKLIKIPLAKIAEEDLLDDDTVFMATKKHFDIVSPSQLRYNIHSPFPVVYITQDEKRLENCGWKIK